MIYIWWYGSDCHFATMIIEFCMISLLLNNLIPFPCVFLFNTSFVILIFLATWWKHPFIYRCVNGNKRTNSSFILQYSNLCTPKGKLIWNRDVIVSFLFERGQASHHTACYLNMYLLIFRSSDTKLHSADCVRCYSTGLWESYGSNWRNSCCKTRNPFVWVLP